jgi:rubredoxin/uncharacterized membrane protein
MMRVIDNPFKNSTKEESIMKKWQCTVCGYIHEGEEPPEECPVCGADKSKFVLLQEKPTGTIPKEPDPADSQIMPDKPVSKWRCTVCGYIHEGIEPPDICPVCGADKSKFTLLKEDAADHEKTAKAKPDSNTRRPSKEEPFKAKQTDSTTETGETRSATAFPSKRFDKLGQLLTRFHGHPIAVHIPNGLLPVAVLFALIALMFGSQGFATAAKYNTIAVALAMPLVIFTGLVDWNNRYGRRMTHVFVVKMICAGIVTVLSLVLGIWWLFSPGMHARGFGANGFFFFLNLVNLAAAIVAGWYGGKLVFKK